MNKSYMIFQINLKKIAFKSSVLKEQSISFNLLHSKCFLKQDNKKIDNTDTILVIQNQKSVDLSSLKTMIFDTKSQTSKYPILIEVIFGQQKPKKIILRRSDILKQHQNDGKSDFFLDEDFGTFSIYYQVILKTKIQNSKDHQENSKSNKISNSQNIVFRQSQKQLKITSKSDLSPLSRSIKRPSMLAVGQAAARIRKSSNQMKQSTIKIQSENQLRETQQHLQSANPYIPSLTLQKTVDDDKQIVKKNVKVNLFQNFKQKDSHQQNSNIDNQLKTKESHGLMHQKQITQSQLSRNNHMNKNHEAQNHGHSTHKSEQNAHHKISGDEHGHVHEHQDQHNDSTPLSIKLKIVIFMLIVGFLFLMYDALDDKFSRRTSKNEFLAADSHENHGSHAHHQNTHSNNHEEKKKKSKKERKQSNHH